jgi:tRNA threonylcarbamoyladenosine biosynthesis protein TsaB
MAVNILSIDTSLDIALICLSQDGKPCCVRTNNIQKEHAVFVHSAIQEIMAEQKMEIHQLDAIAVTEGPGSYTGLRVGMSAAKGLCYALNKPLIAVGSLPMIAYADILVHKDEAILYGPMIDARRMEVYTALYDYQLGEVIPPQAMILDEYSFSASLKGSGILFSGNGAAKWKSLIFSANASFTEGSAYAESLSYLSYKFYFEGKFSDLVALKPLYIKDPSV